MFGVCCGTLKKRGKTQCVDSKNTCVCTFKTSVYGHHAHMCAWCRYTRRRFERTHGDVLNGHTGNRWSSPVLFTRILPTFGYHVLQRFTEETFGPFQFVSLRIG